MKRQTISAMVMAVVTSGSLCYWSEVAFAGPEDGDHAALVAGNTEFALDLYAHLRDADGNLFLSPFSVSTALAMTYGGARGPTAAQMAQTLHFDLPQEQLHPAFAALADLWDRGDDQVPYQLSVANALWVQQGLSLLETFTELNRVHHGAGLRELDFQGATEQTRRTINTWVERQTEGKITDLLKPGVIDHITRLVLTNAVYFKGTWKFRFDPKQTAQAPSMPPPTGRSTCRR